MVAAIVVEDEDYYSSKLGVSPAELAEGDREGLHLWAQPSVGAVGGCGEWRPRYA
jgi:hypothetical protein